MIVKNGFTYDDEVYLNSKQQYGYGLSEYVSMKVVVPDEMGDYRPVNDPTSDKVDLSLGAGKDGLSIGASYTITHSDLEITNKSDTPNKKYYEVYNYLPQLVNPLANNKYVANESSQYGMVQFETTKTSYTFNLNLDARFGAASNNAASPWLVYINYVMKNTATKDITFTLK